MPQNRVQFQKSLKMTDFLDRFGTEAKCETELERIRFPNGFRCPKCDHDKCYTYLHGDNRTFQCKSCRRETTLTSGTIFQGSRLPLFTWFYAMYLLTQSKNNVSALELTRTLGICYRSAWRLKHKIIQVMTEREDTRKLSGRVEVDDAYLGGERRGGTVGRGSENKIPFVAAVQTDSGGRPEYALFNYVPGFTTYGIELWAKKRMVPGTLVVSDGLACFGGVREAGCEHEVHVVGRGNRGTDLQCFRWVNTLLGNLKMSMKGTYHSIKYAKYAKRYLAEAQYRFNRRTDMKAMFIRLSFACVQNKPRPERWLREVSPQELRDRRNLLTDIDTVRSNMMIAVVQFTHPGQEHGPDNAARNERSWNTSRHKRKFLTTTGRYLDANGRLHEDRVGFWGEWEAPSAVQEIAHRVPDGPRWLHTPIPIANLGAHQVPDGAQNTDPCVFGHCFKYFVCKQPTFTSLRALEAGSVILFGSTIDPRGNAVFQLDTVFVVNNWIDYQVGHPIGANDPRIDATYREVSLDRDCADIAVGEYLRLYFGATPEDPVEGMYSFSPCKRLSASPNGFARVILQDIPGFITNNLFAAPRITKLQEAVKAKSLWNRVVAATREQGAEIGVSFPSP